MRTRATAASTTSDKHQHAKGAAQAKTRDEGQEKADSASSHSKAARDPLNQDCIISNCFFTKVDDLKPIIIRAIPENGQDGRGQAFKQGPSNEDEFVEDLVDKRIFPRLRYKPKVTCCL
jgi:hypothetical protein